MSEPAKFLTAFAKALSTMALYADGHPARERAIDQAYQMLRELQVADVHPDFSFLGEETVYRNVAMREMRDWEWAGRLANAGVQRLEFEDDVPRDEFEDFLEQVLARLTVSMIDTSEARQTKRTTIKFGAIGIKGETKAMQDAFDAPVETATIGYSMGEEIEAVRWMHTEVTGRGALPLIEAESVVRSLSVAMHGESEMVLPLLELRQFDEYTTTHCLNVSVLTMALAEHLGMGTGDVRTFGVAGLLHDLGKVRIPLEILNKPGKLTDDERGVMQAHTVEGAKIIITSDRELDLAAAVAYEHHIMLNGGGYPKRFFERDVHKASTLVHVCDVYDALRTNRPYRSAWETERVLTYLEEKSGSEFDPDVSLPFVKMMRGLEGKVIRPGGLEEESVAGAAGEATVDRGQLAED